MADVLGDTSSTAVIGVGTPLLGTFEGGGTPDQDWYRVSLVAGHHYFINQVLENYGQFDAIGIYDAAGVQVATSQVHVYPHEAFMAFVPVISGDYFVAAISNYLSGDYTLSVDEDVGETPATAATTLQPLRAITGYISADAGYDDDLYRFELSEGDSLPSFQLQATIMGPLAELQHAYLQLFDANGELIAAGTDQLSIEEPLVGTYYIGIGGMKAGTSGYYELGWHEAADVAGPSKSLDDNSNPVPHTPGETTVINVFLGAGGVKADDGDGQFTSKAWSSSERATVEGAFAEFERVANVEFNLVASIAQADFVMLKNDNVRDSGTNDSITLGYWWIGGTDLEYGGASYSPIGVGVFNSATVFWTKETLVPGGYGNITLVHELGHGLGLKHPHDSVPGVDKMDGVRHDDDLGRFDLNQGIYTTMGYNDGWQTQPNTAPSPSDGFGWQNGLMALDIAMLQKLYGRAEYATGDTTYTLPSSDKVGTSFKAIWDTGGVDTIRYTGSKDAVISLQAATLQYAADGGGVVSYVKGVHGGFTIANGVWIENAKSGSGDDWLQGSLRENRLDGGAGRDTVDYSNRYRPIEVTLAKSAAAGVSIDGKAEDIILNIENVVGGAAGDTLKGDGLGNWLTGGKGDDLLRGKGGADRFVFAAKLGAGNADTIADFKHNTDVLALDDKIFKAIGSSLASGEFYAKAGADKADDKDDRVVYDKTTGDLYYDRDGKGGAAAILFATLKHAPTLDHGDFLIV